MRLACLYTTARLFINCPNETKWEISSEVRKVFLILAVCCILLGAGSIYGLYRYIEPQLPDVATLKDVRLQIPMQIYSADGELIAQYGEKRRIPVTLDQIPPEMVKAFIATEDSRFYEHHGVDPVGIFRAASVALFSGHASQGASTITQQLARNFFLSPERTLMRKIKEVFLAIRIEQLLTKDDPRALSEQDLPWLPRLWCRCCGTSLFRKNGRPTDAERNGGDSRAAESAFHLQPALLDGSCRRAA